MRIHRLLSMTACLAILLPALGAFLPTGPTPGDGAAPPARNRYVGVRVCQSCHLSRGEGVAVHTWNDSGHATAYATLASSQAKKIAKERGIADPQKADECLKCHTTAHGAEEREIKRGFTATLGVQCESCHGPGEQHMRARFKAAAAAPEAQVGTIYLQIPDDEIIKAPGADRCLACHNDESPTFEPFCFKARRKEIEHLDRRKERSAEWHAARACGCGEECKCVQAECSKAEAKQAEAMQAEAGKDG